MLSLPGRTIKAGALTFSYRHFGHFAKALEREGQFSVNLGDNMQTFAALEFWREMGVGGEEILEVDRDGIAAYNGEPVLLLMNGCFYEHCFPIPDAIKPVFLGFNCDETVAGKHREYLKKHEPIGCRDKATADALRSVGISSFVSGCATLAFSAEAMPYMPKEYFKDMEFIFQRKIVHDCPLSPGGMEQAKIHAKNLLDYYATQASLVITPLHHAATPCMAMGIPVVIVRKKADSRFDYLKDIVPVHVGPDFSRVDWCPKPFDAGPIRAGFIEMGKNALMRAVPAAD